MVALRLVRVPAVRCIEFAGGWRVRPLDEIQWVLEHRHSPLEAAGEGWRVRAYCKDPGGPAILLRTIDLDPAPVRHFPDRFPEAA